MTTEPVVAMSAQSAPQHLVETVRALGVVYETLSLQSLGDLEAFYATQARFQDPFNDVMGWEGIERIFLHMFSTLRSPRFVIEEEITQGESTFLTWRFYFWLDAMSSKEEQCIEGATHLRWQLTQGKGWQIILHKDYWDAAQELYEKLPLLGALMRWLKAKLKA
jgi:steroid delta-isomerase